jgi:hypothetical protein
MDIETVILDATALVADFSLKSPSIQGLLERAPRRRLRIVVPEVVVREVVGKYGQSLTELLAGCSKISSQAKRLGIGLDLRPPDHAGGVEEYERALRVRLSEIGAETPLPPGTPHLELVDRAVSRRKPFVDSGAGYRDALIWESVLVYAAESAVAFVTNNSADFAESQDDVSLVAADLRADLKARGFPDDRVIICRSAGSAVERLFLRDERLLARLQEEGIVTSEMVLDDLPVILDLEPHPALRLPEDAKLIGVMDLEATTRIVYVKRDGEEVEEEQDSIEILDARHVSDHTALITVKMTVYATVEFFMSSDAGREEVLREYRRSDERVVGGDFYSVERELQLEALATFNTADNKVVAVEVLDLVPRQAWIPTPRQGSALDLTVGDRVRHASFGPGVVTQLQGQGDSREVTVEFEQRGSKRLLLVWAPLELV